MLSLGLQTSWRELREAFAGSAVSWGGRCSANLVLAPVLGAAPVALVRRIPERCEARHRARSRWRRAAPFGVQFTRLVKERAALAVAVTLVLTLLSVLYTPLAAALLLPLEAPVRLPYARVLGVVLLCLVFPVAVGVGLRHWGGPVARALASAAVLPRHGLPSLAHHGAEPELRREAYRSIGLAGAADHAAVHRRSDGRWDGGWEGRPPAAAPDLAANTSMRNVAIAVLRRHDAFPAGNMLMSLYWPSSR